MDTPNYPDQRRRRQQQQEQRLLQQQQQQQQPQQQQEQQQEHMQKYTTVGSIYNPSAVPLQPPTRRGRAVKWPAHTDFATSRASPYASRNQPTSPSTDPNSRSLLQYSPLQQNSARAVSPTASAVGSNSLRVPHSDSFSAANVFCVPPVESDMVEEQDVSENDETLKTFSVKTLANLASYPNPHQRGAQRLLSCRPSAPLASLRGARSDPLGLVTPLGSDGVGEYDAQPPQEQSIYDSILSNGLGAPQPLKAGPPGLRQHKSSNAPPLRYSSPVYTPTSLQQAQAGVESTTSHTTVAQQSSQQARYALDPNARLRYSSEAEGPMTSILGMQSTAKKLPIADTLPADTATEYYEDKHLPTDFNYVTAPISQDWTRHYPLNRFGQSKVRPQDDMQAHRNKINLDWYEGSAMMNKSMATALREKSRRDLERTIGIKSKSKREGRQASQKISVAEANAMPVSEHAKPLISMAYQTLINHPEFTQDSQLPSFPPYNFEWKHGNGDE